MQIIATLDDPSHLGGSADSALLAALQQAASNWGSHISGLGTLTVDLQVQSLGGDTLADGGSDSDTSSGTTLDGRAVTTSSSLYEIQTGQHLPSTQVSQGGDGSDIDVAVSSDVISQLYTGLGGSVPASQYDAVSLFEHEIEHGLGMEGYRDSGTGSIGSTESRYDHYVQVAGSGNAVFTGPNAELVNGGPVALTTLSNGEAYYHFANAQTDPNADDLMSGLGLEPGVVLPISQLDLAVLKDVGIPITDTLVPHCFTMKTLAAGQSYNATGASEIVTAQGSGTVNGGFSGDLVAYAEKGNLTLNCGGAVATVVGLGAANLVLTGGSASSALLAFPGSASTVYQGYMGQDEIINGSGSFYGAGGPGGSLFMFGGTGALAFTGGGEQDVIVLGQGASTVAAGMGAVFGGSGGNQLSALGTGTFLVGSVAGDRVSASAAGGDILAAGSGNETLLGAGSAGADIDFGGAGTDQVLLGHGADSFVAGAGSAVVQVGSGDGMLYLGGSGGAGGATQLDFVSGLTGGSDTISGFRAGVDTLHLSGYGQATTTNGSAGAVLTLTDGTRVLFQGVPAISLPA